VTAKVRVAGLLVAGALALALAGCAIPTQSGPSAIAPSKVPFALLDPHPPTTTTTQPNASVPVKVFFIGPTGQLQPATRVVAPPAPLTAILTAMFSGTTAEEQANGIITAIPNDVAVLSTGTEPGPNPGGSVVTVNLNAAFGSIPGSNTELAVAQVVATVAAENGLGTGVIFEIEGQRTSVPIANGSQTAGPVYLLQFLSAPA
jgi:spore germination protein GerM